MSAQVNLSAAEATVTTEAGKVKPDQLIKAVEEAGFKAELKKQPKKKD